MSNRHFIVHRSGPVVIREVEPGSCAHTLGREAAWDFAMRIARASKRSPKRSLQHAVDVLFQGLDGERRTVATAADVLAKQAAEALADAPVEAPAPEPQPEVAWIDQGRNREVVENLREQQASGRGNDFVESLLGYYERTGRLTEGQTAAVCSGIDKRNEARQTPVPNVPAGHYAVENDEGRLAFYVVDRPEDGRWKGYTFVKVMASDTEHKLPISAAKGVLAKIARDPRSATIAYGKHIGRCGVCNRTLTDENSRAAGIGPYCMEKMGW